MGDLQRVQSANMVKIASATVIRVTMVEYVKNRVASVFVHRGLWETTVKQVSIHTLLAKCVL